MNSIHLTFEHFQKTLSQYINKGLQIASQVASQWHNHAVRVLQKISEEMQRDQKIAIGVILTTNAIFFMIINAIQNRLVGAFGLEQADSFKQKSVKHIVLDACVTGGSFYLFNMGLAKMTQYNLSRDYLIALITSFVSLRLIVSFISEEDAKAKKIEKEKADAAAKAEKEAKENKTKKIALTETPAVVLQDKITKDQAKVDVKGKAKKEAPAPKETEAPATKEKEAPAPKETGAPAAKETGAPAPKETEALTPKETEAPAPKETEAPAAKETGAPAPKETEAPAAKETGAPTPKETEAPVAKETGAPVPKEPEASATKNEASKENFSTQDKEPQIVKENDLTTKETVEQATKEQTATDPQMKQTEGEKQPEKQSQASAVVFEKPQSEAEPTTEKTTITTKKLGVLGKLGDAAANFAGGMMNKTVNWFNKDVDYGS